MGIVRRDVNGAAMSLDDRPADGKPHADARRFGGVECLEDLVRHIGGHADASIAHAHRDLALIRRRADQNFLLFTFLRRLHGIDYDVQDDLLELHAIANDSREMIGQIGAQNDAVANHFAAGQRQGFLDHVDHVDFDLGGRNAGDQLAHTADHFAGARRIRHHAIKSLLGLVLTWWIGRSRIGLALKVIGDDEVVASHVGIDIARTKLALFAVSAVIMTLVGAIQAPRWTYVEPAIVFNPTVSFLVLIMALLGGAARLWGPLLGAVPLFMLFEWLSANFPNHYSILLGLLFILIVFALPKGVLSFVEDNWMKRRGPRAADRSEARS